MVIKALHFSSKVLASFSTPPVEYLMMGVLELNLAFV